MDPDARALRLIQTVYRAAAGAAAWREFTGELSEAFSGALVCLNLGHSRHPASACLHSAGLSEDFGESLWRSLVDSMSWRTSHRADFSLGFTPANKVFPGLALEKTELYRAWMAPRGLPPVWPICLNVATRPLVPDAAIVILRQPDAATSSPFSKAELDFGNLLLPHLQLAFGVQMEISGAEWRRNALQEVIERWHMGVILLDSKGRLLKSNRSADRTLASRAGLRLGDQKLWAPLAEDNRNLQTAIAAATENAARRRFHLEESFYFMRERGRPNLEFTIKPLLSGVPGSTVSDAVVAVLIANLDEVSTFPAKTVRRLYSLTGAEIDPSCSCWWKAPPSARPPTDGMSRSQPRVDSSKRSSPRPGRRSRAN